MKEKIVNVGDTRVNFVCTFTAAEVDAERESIIGKFCAEANVPGFRRGKVPKNIALMKFSDAIEKQLEASIANKTIEAFHSKQSNFAYASVINVEHGRDSDANVCTLSLDVIPKFTLPDYLNIPVTQIDDSISERDIDDEVRRFLKQYARYSTVDRAAEMGDFVKLNYSGKFADGSSVADGGTIPAIYGTQTNTWEEAGDHNSNQVRAIVDGILGAKPGDRKVVSEKFDKNFPVAQLAGKIVNYELEIFEVRECILPTLSDDMLGAFSVKSEAELREKMRTSLAATKKERAQSSRLDEFVSKLCSMCDVKIPESLLLEEATKLTNNLASHRMSRGASVSEMRNHPKQIFDGLMPIAEQHVKIGVILDEIAKIEKIEISTQEIENIMWQEISMQRTDANKYIGELKRDSSKVMELRRRTLRSKTLNHLMSEISKNPKNKSASETVDIGAKRANSPVAETQPSRKTTAKAAERKKSPSKKTPDAAKGKSAAHTSSAAKGAAKERGASAAPKRRTAPGTAKPKPSPKTKKKG
ncbi:MAG: trigger factor [Puniceicoccales bacterium]|nr:trigger factor [Puniceicoccales bacterium]